MATMNQRKVVVSDLVEMCTKAKDLQAAKELQRMISKQGLDASAIFGNHLVRMFSMCGSLSHAKEAFHKIAKPDAYSWNAIISAHAKLGYNNDAFGLYKHMQILGVKPNVVTFLCILKVCCHTLARQQGRHVHHNIICCGVQANLAIQNTLLHMYAKCGCLEEARKVFDMMPHRDIVTWAAMITGYVQQEHGLLAMDLFEKMQKLAIKPSKVVFLSVLKACTIIGSFDHGREVHDSIVRDNFDLDEQVGSMLIDMYAGCGTLQEAQRVFDSLPNTDVVVWSSLIAGYVESGNSRQAMELFEDMQSVALAPDRVIFIQILKACGGLSAYGHGWLIHDLIVRSNIDRDKVVMNSLIDMYAQWGDMEGASSVFNGLACPDEVSWGAMLAGYVRHGHDHLAFQVFAEMQMKEMRPDKPIFLLGLKVCGSLVELLAGNLIHQQIVESGISLDVVVATALVDMHGKCGRVDEAKYVFERVPKKDIGAWDTLLAAYANHDHHNTRAIELFMTMQQEEDLKPSKNTYLCILKVLGGLKAARLGYLMHDVLIRSAVELDNVVENTLVDMYAKCGLLKEARNLFDRLLKPNEVSWGAMISGYAALGKGHSALRLFEKMPLHEEGQENAVVLSSVLKGCGTLGAMEQGRIIHDRVIRSGLNGNAVWNALVDVYAKCGSIDEAQKVFRSISVKDVVSWGALMAGYTQQGDGLRALALYKSMQQENTRIVNKAILLCALQACGTIGALEEGQLVFKQIMEEGYELDMSLGNMLVDMYAKCRSMHEAWNVFKMLPNRDMVSWGVLMAGFVRNSQSVQVEWCLQNMRQQGLNPGDCIFTSVLAACGHARLAEEGLRYFGLMSGKYGILPGQKHYSCISDLLCRAGYFHEVVELLKTMPMAPDIILWTSLLDSCTSHGNKGLGDHCFEELLETDPEDASWYVLMSKVCADACIPMQSQFQHHVT